MSRRWARLKGLFSNRTMVGMDKAGNRYFAVTEELDGEIAELEARRERVMNVELLKKEEVERKARETASGKVGSTGKVAGPDLKRLYDNFQLPHKGRKLGKHILNQLA